MADWVNIIDTAIDPDAPLTSELAYAWRDNPIAISEGAAGAPRISRVALKSNTTSLSGTLTATGNVTLNLGAFAFFPSMTGDTRIRLGLNSGTPSADSGYVTLYNTADVSVPYSVSWRRLNE